jgi:hypothetical protein
VRLIPFAKVDEAVAEVTLRSAVFSPALNVVVAAPEKVLISERRVVEALDPVVTHTPFTEKQPEVKLIPFAKVEDAEDEVTLRRAV